MGLYVTRKIQRGRQQSYHATTNNTVFWHLFSQEVHLSHITLRYNGIKNCTLRKWTTSIEIQGVNCYTRLHTSINKNASQHLRYKSQRRESWKESVIQIGYVSLTVCLMYVNLWEEDNMKFVFNQRVRYKMTIWLAFDIILYIYRLLGHRKSLCLYGIWTLCMYMVKLMARPIIIYTHPPQRHTPIHVLMRYNEWISNSISVDEQMGLNLSWSLVPVTTITAHIFCRNITVDA